MGSRRLRLKSALRLRLWSLLLAGVSMLIPGSSFGQSAPRPPQTTKPSSDDLIAKREELYKDALAAASSGNWKAAVGTARAALSLQRQHLGADTADTCTILEYIAAWQELDADYAGALITWRELEPLSTKARGHDHCSSVSIRVAADSCRRATQLSVGDQRGLADAAQVNLQAERLFVAGKYAEARKSASTALETRAAMLGRDDVVTAASLHNVGAAYVALGDVKNARRFLEECVVVRERVYGHKNPSTLSSLGYLSLVYDSLGEAQLARPILEKNLAGSSAVYGPEHPATVTAMFQIGNFYLTQDDVSQSEPILLSVAKLQRAIYGPASVGLARTLGRLGMLYAKKRDHAQAERHLRQSFEIYQKLLGGQHVDTARALVSLGTIEYVAKHFSPAKQHLRQAVETLRSSLGETHPETIEAMHTLARTLPPLGEHAAAERLYRDVLRGYGQSTGYELQTAAAHWEIGLLYSGWNDVGGAERHLKQAQAIHRRILGEAHTDTAAVMVALAVAEARSGRHEQAEKTCREALAITEQALGAIHIQTVAVSAVLGSLLLLQDKYDQAEQHLEGVLARRPDRSVDDRYQNAILLNKLASISLKQGDYAEAISRSSGVMAAYREALPANHPHWADTLLVAGVAHLALHRHDEAKKMAERALEVARRQLDMTSMAQSERQQLALTYRLRQILDLQLSLPPETVAADEAYQQLLLWKGAIQARQIRDRQQRPGDAMPSAAELRQVCTRLASASLHVPDRSDRVAWLEQLEELKVRKELLEADLASISRDFRAQREPAAVTLAKLQSVLPRGTVLVDVLEYMCFSGTQDKSAPDESRYVAFVVRYDQPVARVELGSAQRINDTIEQWRRDCIYTGHDVKEDHGRLLRKLVWKPLESHLDGCQTVLVSPDSGLSRLPFCALPGEQPGSYLIEDVAIGVIPVPQMLPEMFSARPARAPLLPQHSPAMLIVGDVDYDAAPGESAESGPDQLSKESLGGELLTFDRLKSAPEEIQALREQYYQRFPEGKLLVLDGAKATEAAFRREAPGHPWLLVATHGFFAPPNINSALAVQDELAGLDVAHGSDHSGALSGLALAGANLPPAPDGDDGILTAYEVAALDLCKVEFAVLSACETGLGKNAFGESPMGMQRAFQVAGVGTTVASLWNVPDGKTSQLMQRFYANLWDKKMPKLQALREAQMWIMRTGGAQSETTGKDVVPSKSRAPYFWAAFVLSGDWR